MLKDNIIVPGDKIIFMYVWGTIFYICVWIESSFTSFLDVLNLRIHQNHERSRIMDPKAVSAWLLPSPLRQQ